MVPPKPSHRKEHFLLGAEPGEDHWRGGRVVLRQGGVGCGKSHASRNCSSPFDSRPMERKMSPVMGA